VEITTHFLTAKAKNKAWAGVFGYRPDKDSQRELLGEMYAVLSIKADIDFDLPNLGNWLLDELQDVYFKPTKEEAGLDQFEAAVKSVGKRIEMIMDREPELAENGIDFEMAVSVVKDGLLYLGVVGESKVMVSRGEDAAEIGGVLIDSEMDGFARTGSLQLEPNDRVLLMTSDLHKSQGESKLIKALDQFDISGFKVVRGGLLAVGYDLGPEFLEAKSVQPVLDMAPESKQVLEKPEPAPEVEATTDEKVTEVEEDSVVEVDELTDKELDEKVDDVKKEVELAKTRKPEPELDEVFGEEDGEVDDPEFKHKGHPLGMDAGDLDGEYDEEYDDERKTPIAKLSGAARGAFQGVLTKISAIRNRGDEGEYIEDDLDEEIFDKPKDPIPEKVKVQDKDEGKDKVEAKSKDEVEEPEEFDRFDRTRNLKPVEPDVEEVATSGIMGKVKPMLSRGSGQAKQLLSRTQDVARGVRHGRPGDRSTYVKGGRRPGFQMSTRWRIGAVVIVVALVVVVFGVRQTIINNEIQAHIDEVETQVTALDTELNRLSVQANTASIGAGQEVERERVFNELTKLQANAETLKSEEIQVDVLTRIISDVSREQDKLMKVNAFTQPQIVTDLAVNFQGVNAVDLEYSNGQLYVVDQARGVIYRTGTAIQSEVNNFVSGLVNPSLMIADENGDLVFLDQASESVIGTIAVIDGNVRRHPGMSGDKVGSLSALFIWPNNAALYSINQIKTAVIKQESVAGNYQIPGDGSAWRTDGEFGQAVDLAVDGSVYVLIKGKGLQRYWGGEPAGIKIQGLVSSDVAAITQATAFELTTSRLFIVDSINNRIMVFELSPDDQGPDPVYDYVEQIKYRGTDDIFTDIRDIVIVPGEQSERLFVLDGSKVIRIDR